MTRMVPVVLALVLSTASAYHDPDLNYHLNKLRDCDTPGYHYPAPAVQLSTAGVKYAAPLPAYNAYLPPVPPPNTYLPPPAPYVPHPAPYVPPVAPPTGYLPPYAHTSYSAANNFFSHPARQPPKHVTGWHTGAEQYNFPPARTAVPHALYNQAPILGKITAAPLFTKYSAPQNQLGYYGKTLNTFGTETGGAVVTHAYGNPTGVYATSRGILPTTPAPIVQLWPSPTPPAPQPPLAPLPQSLPPAPLPAVTYHGAPLSHLPQLPQLPVVPKPFAHAKNVHTDFVENYDANPQYSYEYGVHDSRTGDIKHQAETRNGEVVRGQYSLVEPDGSVRTVDYVADWDTGFHANVRNSKDQQH